MQHRAAFAFPQGRSTCKRLRWAIPAPSTRRTPQIYMFPPGGAMTETAIDPTNTQTGILTADSADNLFVGGYAIDELTPGGTQTQVNTAGAGDRLFADAISHSLFDWRLGGVAGYGLRKCRRFDRYDGQPARCVDGTGRDSVCRKLHKPRYFRQSTRRGCVRAQIVGTAATPQTISLYNGATSY